MVMSQFVRSLATHRELMHFSEAEIGHGTERCSLCQRTHPKKGQSLPITKWAKILRSFSLKERWGAGQLRLDSPTCSHLMLTPTDRGDRRDRGEGTDTNPHAVQKEIEDIEALIESAD